MHFAQRQAARAAIGQHFVHLLDPAADKGTEGALRTLLGAGLEVLAQEHEGYGHRGGLEVEVLQRLLLPPEEGEGELHEAVAIGHPCAEGDQQVHPRSSGT